MSYTYFLALQYEVYSKAFFNSAPIPMINGTQNLSGNLLS